MGSGLLIPDNLISGELLNNFDYNSIRNQLFFFHYFLQFVKNGPFHRVR